MISRNRLIEIVGLKTVEALEAGDFYHSGLYTESKQQRNRTPRETEWFTRMDCITNTGREAEIRAYAITLLTTVDGPRKLKSIYYDIL